MGPYKLPAFMTLHTARFLGSLRPVWTLLKYASELPNPCRGRSYTRDDARAFRKRVAKRRWRRKNKRAS